MATPAHSPELSHHNASVRKGSSKCYAIQPQKGLMGQRITLGRSKTLLTSTRTIHLVLHKLSYPASSRLPMSNQNTARCRAQDLGRSAQQLTRVEMVAPMHQRQLFVRGVHAATLPPRHCLAKGSSR